MADELGRLISQWADETAPPRPPKSEMWAAIRTRRDQPVARRFNWMAYARIGWTATGVAAALAAFSFSRSMGSAPSHASEAVGLEFPAPKNLDADVIEHLEAVLDLLSDYDAGLASSQETRTATELLSQTRLLIASGRLEGVEVTDLFDDVELLLIQLVQLASGDRTERELFNDSILSRSVLTRIRGLIGPVPTA